MSSELDALGPPALSRVTFGTGKEAVTLEVRALKLKQLPEFARALGAIGPEISAMLQEGVSFAGVLALVEQRLPDVIDALAVATGATAEQVGEATAEQALEGVLAVLQANRNFFKGRAAAALRMAAVISGDGPTASRPSSAPAGHSPTSKSSTSSSSKSSRKQPIGSTGSDGSGTR